MILFLKFGFKLIYLNFGFDFDKFFIFLIRYVEILNLVWLYIVDKIMLRNFFVEMLFCKRIFKVVIRIFEL